MLSTLQELPILFRVKAKDMQYLNILYMMCPTHPFSLRLFIFPL